MSSSCAKACKAAGYDLEWDADRTRDRRIKCDLTDSTHTWPAWNPFLLRATPALGIVKNVIFGIVLVPVRVVLMLLTLILLLIYLELAVLGADTTIPLSDMRRRCLVTPIKVASRCLLFIYGFYWISEKYIEPLPEDKGKPRASAVIANHSGYMEILFMAARTGCCFVAKAALAKMPLYGTLMRCSQCIFVDRGSGKSHASAQIKERAKHPDKWPMLALYPEGTTTNGSVLINFHTGAFIAGVPVRPMIVKYSAHLFDPHFTCKSLAVHGLGVLCQPYMFMNVIHMPTYYPSAAEKANPKLYANNVRDLMSRVGQIPMYDMEWACKLEFEPPKKRTKSIAALRQRQAAKKKRAAKAAGAPAAAAAAPAAAPAAASADSGAGAAGPRRRKGKKGKK